MTLAGYGGGAVRALDFCVESDGKDYQWNEENRKWVKVKEGINHD